MKQYFWFGFSSTTQNRQPDANGTCCLELNRHHPDHNRTLCTELISIWLSDANPDRVSDNSFAERRTPIQNPFIQFWKTCDRRRCRIQWEKNRRTFHIPAVGRGAVLHSVCLYFYDRFDSSLCASFCITYFVRNKKWINNNQWCAIPLFARHIFKTSLIFIVHLWSSSHRQTNASRHE